MSLFPTLTAMGVSSFEQISRYSLHTEGGEEILKIYYQRPNDSALPRTKKFQQPVPESNGQTTRPSRLFDAASELNALTKNRNTPQQQRQQLAQELEQLEQVMQSKLSELRRRLEHWDL
ncbi:MAG: Ser/Thr protein kinase RdoA (MazF antagonist) [Motiliproteus sp.]|jgi:Ser/Thr protein kinase RdoA (MazF antagonist)